MDCKCQQEKDCSCEVKDLGTRCIIYDGELLPNLNVETHTDLTTILEKIDYQFSQEANPVYVNVLNIGSGEGVFKQLDILGRVQLKTIISEDNLITINGLSEEIGIGVDRGELSNIIQQEASTNFVYSPQSVIESYDSSSNTLSFKNFVAGSNIQIQNIGQDITISATSGSTGVTTIESETLSVQPITGGYKIDTVRDYIRRIYVNNTYTGGNSNGTISRPYSSIQQAFTAYIGTGTNLNPQFAGDGTITHVQRTGVEYSLPDNLLIKDLNLFLESGVRAVNSVPSSSSAIINFNDAVTDKFQITIQGEDPKTTTIQVRRPFIINGGYGAGSSDNSFIGNHVRVEGIRLTKGGVNTLNIGFINGQVGSPTGATGDAIPNHNNGQAPFEFVNVDFYGNTSTQMLNLTNSNNVTFKDCKFYFSTASETSTTPNFSVFFSGVYTRFDNCHFVCRNVFTSGSFQFKNNGTQGQVDFINPTFEGNVSNLFVFPNDAQKIKVMVRGAIPVFQNFTKVVSSTSQVTTVTMMNNIFTSPKGDVDLTKGNTISVSNYFNDKLTESLIKSPNILTTAQQPEGTVYMYTGGSTDPLNWKRLNV